MRNDPRNCERESVGITRKTRTPPAETFRGFWAGRGGLSAPVGRRGGGLRADLIGLGRLANAVMRSNLLVLVADLVSKPQRGVVLRDGVVWPVGGEQHLAEAVQRVGFA